ncbi:protein adenylyltransferase SelO family protein [Glacieibacterium sp.]|uniref:protein adenylyltransferase SelO family protein n=1 Tax=Glacieibacterium sp. TaxID=2860237 RepID=UPI003AFF6278
MTDAFRPSRAILELGPGFYDEVAPADFPLTIPRFRNDRAAASIGLDDLDPAAWLRHFGRFEALPGSLEHPLALRYHGHQFRSYNPEIGDGRGFLFAQMTDTAGRLMDLGTKGSGQTPYSRFGDGRLTLKGGVREILATEMLEALGATTSRTLSLIETGEALQRGDEPSPTRSAVMVRLNHSHIRYGSFQRLAALQDAGGMATLTDYVLRHYFEPSDTPAPSPYATLIDHAVTNSATQAAQLMAAGFVHGVLNTDNINITGEIFDFGPYRFAPAWDPDFTAAYFDHNGLYSLGRQPEAMQWNVYQLALALRLVAPTEDLAPALKTWPDRFDAAFATAMLARLGVVPRDPATDLALARSIEAALTETTMPLARFWFDWRGGTLRGTSPAAATYALPAFAPFLAAVADYAPAAPLDHAYWSDPEPCALLIDEIEAIWSRIATDDDWSTLEGEVVAIRRMGEAMR